MLIAINPGWYLLILSPSKGDSKYYEQSSLSCAQLKVHVGPIAKRQIFPSEKTLIVNKDAKNLQFIGLRISERSYYLWTEIFSQYIKKF